MNKNNEIKKLNEEDMEKVSGGYIVITDKENNTFKIHSNDKELLDSGTGSDEDETADLTWESIRNLNNQKISDSVKKDADEILRAFEGDS